jgi:hypothetical protein
MTQDVRADVGAVIEQVMADHTVSSSEMLGVPREIARAVEQAGLTTSTGTIAFAGQYATGSFAVQYNSPTGGFSSTWPEWAFNLAKDALLGNRRVWVASNGDPFGSNLVFVMIFP